MMGAVADYTQLGSELGTGTVSSPYRVQHLSDTELIAGARGLVARSNQHLARLLAHLAEVEARGIHRARACASLTTYCIYELRLSEDTAFRYARAARHARDFPILLEHLAVGEIHLTGLLLLGPHLTEENHREVLKLAKHRSKREITRLVRQLDPLPSVPARIEPLGPAPLGSSPSNASWEAFLHALNPVRELVAEQCPKEWLKVGEESAVERAASDGSSDAPRDSASDVLGPDSGDAPILESVAKATAPALESVEQSDAPLPRVQRYSVQFTARQEYVRLVERARDLLSHAVPDRSLEEIHLRAMRLLVAELEKRKFAISGETRRRGAEPQEGAVSAAPAADGQRAEQPDASETSGIAEAAKVPYRRGTSSRDEGVAVTPRYVPARVRREVHGRDGGRCTFVSAEGVRCRETAFLELHHITPHARSGAATTANLALRCRAHNALAAENDFGRTFMVRRSGREGCPHES
ncbi:MAG TPA: hypothetical protein VIM73_15225 [Polyangiaceae bacterium]